jgi:hypothetical protein
MLYTESDPDGYIGKEFESGDLKGVCDQVEIEPANFTNIETDELVAAEKIRLRLRPENGRARWTDCFPYKKQDTP